MELRSSKNKTHNRTALSGTRNGFEGKYFLDSNTPVYALPRKSDNTLIPRLLKMMSEKREVEKGTSNSIVSGSSECSKCKENVCPEVEELAADPSIKVGPAQRNESLPYYCCQVSTNETFNIKKATPEAKLNYKRVLDSFIKYTSTVADSNSVEAPVKPDTALLLSEESVSNTNHKNTTLENEECVNDIETIEQTEIMEQNNKEDTLIQKSTTKSDLNKNCIIRSYTLKLKEVTEKKVRREIETRQEELRQLGNKKIVNTILNERRMNEVKE